jgi:hypothetical protein
VLKDHPENCSLWPPAESWNYRAQESFRAAGTALLDIGALTLRYAPPQSRPSGGESGGPTEIF